MPKSFCSICGEITGEKAQAGRNFCWYCDPAITKEIYAKLPESFWIPKMEISPYENESPTFAELMED